jgi:hypothetical protein
MLGREAFLCGWKSGEPLRPGHAPHRQAVAKALRAFHEMVHSSSRLRAFPAVQLPLHQRVSQLGRMLEGVAPAAKPIADRIEQAGRQSAPAVKEYEHAQPPLRLSPEELRGDNLLFQGDHLAAVLDLDGSRWQYALDALAQAALWHSIDPKAPLLPPPPTWAEITAFVADYTEGHEDLTDLERQAFRGLLMLHAARAAAFWPEYFQKHVERWQRLAEAVERKGLD